MGLKLFKEVHLSLEGNMKRTKIFGYMVWGIVCLIVIAVVGLVVYEKTKPLCDSVTTANLKVQTAETNDYILAKISDEYYQTSASVEFSSIFSFDEWELVSHMPDSELCISLRFSELYILEIYYGGYAAAQDGYASTKNVSYAYYTIPEDVGSSIMSYLRQNGIPHEMGDGTIGMGTFIH